MYYVELFGFALGRILKLEIQCLNKYNIVLKVCMNNVVQYFIVTKRGDRNAAVCVVFTAPNYN